MGFLYLTEKEKLEMVKCEDCKKKIIEENKKKSEQELFFEKWSDKKYCLEQV